MHLAFYTTFSWLNSLLEERNVKLGENRNLSKRSLVGLANLSCFVEISNLHIK